MVFLEFLVFLRGIKIIIKTEMEENLITARTQKLNKRIKIHVERKLKKFPSQSPETQNLSNLDH